MRYRFVLSRVPGSDNGQALAVVERGGLPYPTRICDLAETGEFLGEDLWDDFLGLRLHSLQRIFVTRDDVEALVLAGRADSLWSRCGFLPEALEQCGPAHSLQQC